MATPAPPVLPVGESKPGYYTTEFWLTILFNLFSLLNVTGIWDYMPNSWSVIAAAIVNALYALSRGQAKQGIPYEAPPSRTARR